jgi:SAM-dependent methyltransferase
MVGELGWIPDDMDVKRPSLARIYDYALGGGHNLASDRAMFEQLLLIEPNLREIAWINRSFMRRTVLFMLKRGIRQFLDLGSGIPTAGNVHEIAQKNAPETKVVYVDREDVAVAHSRLLLDANPNATMVEADIIRPGDVLRHPETLRMLNFTKPLGLLAITVGHYVRDEQVFDVFSRYRDALAPGSVIAISHITGDFEHVRSDELADSVAKDGAERINVRTRGDILPLFGDFELVEPGLVPPSNWHPDNVAPGSMHAGDEGMWAGVGIKR